MAWAKQAWWLLCRCLSTTRGFRLINSSLQSLIEGLFIAQRAGSRALADVLHTSIFCSGTSTTQMRWRPETTDLTSALVLLD
ncbi:hypothetical protein F5883DRAFT_103414 [Diaporthe sp. PMI_573]|nr:hypothetical protein F5883DRAFT_103414 [Diaporthaceae sp. PMI_573]